MEEDGKRRLRHSTIFWYTIVSLPPPLWMDRPINNLGGCFPLSHFFQNKQEHMVQNPRPTQAPSSPQKNIQNQFFQFFHINVPNLSLRYIKLLIFCVKYQKCPLLLWLDKGRNIPKRCQKLLKWVFLVKKFCSSFYCKVYIYIYIYIL